MWPLPFLYPPSALEAVMSVGAVVSLAGLGLSELCGENLAYSKFCDAGRGRKRGVGVLLPSRAGMLMAYATGLITVAAASFALPGVLEGERTQVLTAAFAIHLLKRALEVLFLHRHSGRMPLTTALAISTYYLLIVTGGMIYVQHLSHGLPNPTVHMLYPGVFVFAIGLTGNFYHHYILSRLRDNAGDKGYKIPRGGLFNLVTCPHYLFEILGFFGFAMICQTLYAFAVALGTVAHLTGRSCATRRWYASKFEEFPTRIKAIIPYFL